MLKLAGLLLLAYLGLHLARVLGLERFWRKGPELHRGFRSRFGGEKAGEEKQRGPASHAGPIVDADFRDVEEE